MELNPNFSSNQICLKQYPHLLRKEKDAKEEYIKIRILKRKGPKGTLETVLDIRQYITDIKKSMFTPKGLYFYQSDLDFLINVIQDAKKAMEGYGTDSRNRS